MTKKPETLCKEHIVAIWMLKGLDDFYFGFCLNDKSRRQNVFFCHQGLEKLSKAYLLGKEASRYEDLPSDEGKEKVNKIVKKEYGHSLEWMLHKLIAFNVLEKEILTKQYDTYAHEEKEEGEEEEKHKSFSGKDCLQSLQAAYLECRYPMQKYVHQNYRIKGGYWYSPLDSSGIKVFAYEAGLKIYNKIRDEYDLSFSNSYEQRKDDEDWQRFCRLFFK